MVSPWCMCVYFERAKEEEFLEALGRFLEINHLLQRSNLLRKWRIINNFMYHGVVGHYYWSSFIDQSDGSIYDDFAATLQLILPPDDLNDQFSLTPNQSGVSSVSIETTKNQNRSALENGGFRTQHAVVSLATRSRSDFMPTELHRCRAVPIDPFRYRLFLTDEDRRRSDDDGEETGGAKDGLGCMR
ncbi:hypothetical protein Ccrd_001830 [Cynara cardunculus var. scolymus]|uniref:Uncharacterized protein n=1 Tax=Cynara cardunculus var. scolymus TaxID=59895 RepID=A0A103XSH3_CYNCS|nr:hypothetical protein Ccrd_001830 [Cynara cardunculus var. scolymus]